jgi:hypothetical protein
MVEVRSYCSMEAEFIVEADEVPAKAGCLRAVWGHQGIKR